jgi:membrane protein involved in colicin uptake
MSSIMLLHAGVGKGFAISTLPLGSMIVFSKALQFNLQPAEARREQEYRTDQEKLKDENLHLRQRVAFELERCKELERDLTQLEREMEMEEEKYAARLLRLPLALFLILLSLNS